MSLLMGTQLYAWRQVYSARGEKLEEHYDEVLSAIRDMGMATAENSLDRLDLQGLRDWAAMLRGHDLQTVSMYSGGAFHDKDAAAKTVDELLRAGEVMAAEGFSVLSLNPDPIGREKSDEELATQAENLDRLGRGLRAMRIALGLHNHTPEMVNGGREFHHNLRETTPDAVGLCMDVHWCWRGGADPYAIFEEYRDRIVALHVRQSRDGTWAEDFCDGDVDYRPIIQPLVESRFTGPVLIELAIEEGTPQTRDVVENHRRSVEYLRELQGHGQ